MRLPRLSRLLRLLPRPVSPRPQLPQGTVAGSSSRTPTATPVVGDGVADPGEVVWAWVPYEDDPSQGKDRPVLVVRREGDDVLVLPMTSKDHDRDAAQEARAGRTWMDVGTGAWDSRRRPSEVRLDRVVRLRASAVRREGAVLDPALFAEVLAAARL
ncbi:hypothetical protein GCM10027425_11720 [Alteromonas gracilis]